MSRELPPASGELPTAPRELPTASRDSPSAPLPVGHCSHCGYDQRGLPAGSVCPECSHAFVPGQDVHEINRWADHALLRLWAVAVLQVIAMFSLVMCFLAARQTVPGGIMLAMISAVYSISACLWYGATATAFAYRAMRPVLKNLTQPRRERLVRWMIIDGVLTIIPIGLFVRMIGYI